MILEYQFLIKCDRQTIKLLEDNIFMTLGREGFLLKLQKPLTIKEKINLKFSSTKRLLLEDIRS